MKNVSKSTIDVTFARGLVMSELGSTGATWRPAIAMTPPMQASTHAPVLNTYAAAALSALPAIKTTAPSTNKQHLVKTDAGRDNRTNEGPSSRRIPV